MDFEIKEVEVWPRFIGKDIVVIFGDEATEDMVGEFQEIELYVERKDPPQKGM